MNFKQIKSTDEYIFTVKIVVKVFCDYDKSKIEVTCLKGNIKNLLNIWEFKEIDKKNCRVDFFIDIELKNPIVNILFNKFFDYGFDKILDSFQQRAKETIKG